MTLARRMTHVWVLLVMGLGCGGPVEATEIVLVIDSDWTDLARVRVELRGFGDGRPIDIEMTDTRPPRSLGLAHNGGPLGPFDVVVSGYAAGASTAMLVEPRTEIYFERGETMALRVELRALCAGVCQPHEACLIDRRSQPECKASDGAAELMPWKGADALIRLQAHIPARPDGGMSDAGRESDGGGDGGDGDAAVPEPCASACAMAPEMAHVLSAACVDAECRLTCEDGWASCDGRPENGCETELRRHCGPCAGTPIKRKTLTIDSPIISTELNEFPVLVALDDTDLEAADDSGLDLCFAAAGETNPLPFELDDWERASGRLRAWVKLDAISADQPTTFHLYYGDGQQTDRAAPATVWDSGYRAVWHMSDARDSTAGLTGTVEQAQAAPGLVGQAYRLNGAEGYVVFDQDELDGVFQGGATVEAWIRPYGWGENGFGRIVDKSADTNSAGGWGLYVREDMVASSTLCFAYDFGGLLSRSWVAPNDSLSLDTWHHVAVTYDPVALTRPLLFVDGQLVETIDVALYGSEPVDDAPHPLRIGNHAAESVRTFDGTIDEVRISQGARSAAWLSAQTENVADPTRFMTAGPEETVR